ncbi:hypothetical protein TVAG_213390 [Trichomonas vaginalis G3]|uniref:Uncharacterized protein n=1 Tax=Trichomonas vaginalis (strain ATCC PRA-98 / G3) TaxID=412133 RepID=A2EEW4_TRIV3|nr:hypothetical protein TVAGG3_0061790 [Trichomonas vaginalis G3]EAY08830.1 hypothetical protein TVAG_213390 [Trichomonas vaginalis G3]KAI5542064.1 hypothetical protein TVAGG3_0061790 [Trichomonas vaginalis G3]|eukprot:XP_001321053.1 hypothetical protein [Trichomonas vaginalis G3]
MYFLGVLHSLVQLPKDLYNTGISDCHRAVNVPFGDSSNGKLVVRMEKIDRLQETLIRRVKGAFPEITETELDYFKTSTDEMMTAKYWDQKITRKVCINGYSVRSSQSINFILTLSNINSPPNTVSVLFTVCKSDYIFINSFAAITLFSIVDGKVENVVSSIPASKITQMMVACVASSIAPEYFGTHIATESSLSPIVDYIEGYLNKYVTVLKYINENEAQASINDFRNNNNVVDFASISDRIRKVCLTTPTPSPEPTATPAPEQPVSNKKLEKKHRRSHRHAMRG